MVQHVKVKKVSSTKEKKRWLGRFYESYNYPVERNLEAQTQENSVFLKASVGGKGAGFVRINDKSTFFRTSVTETIFNLADAYVVEKFRGNGVYRALLNQAIGEMDVHMVCLHPEVYRKHRDWYAELGFSHLVTGSQSDLRWLLDDFAYQRS